MNGLLLNWDHDRFMARKSGQVNRGGKAQPRPRCWGIDEFFAGNRQAELPCGTRALWNALSARRLITGDRNRGRRFALPPSTMVLVLRTGRKNGQCQSRRTAAETFKLQERLKQDALTAAIEARVGFTVVQSRSALSLPHNPFSLDPPVPVTNVDRDS